MFSGNSISNHANIFLAVSIKEKKGKKRGEGNEENWNIKGIDRNNNRAQEFNKSCYPRFSRIKGQRCETRRYIGRLFKGSVGYRVLQNAEIFRLTITRKEGNEPRSRNVDWPPFDRFISWLRNVKQPAPGGSFAKIYRHDRGNGAKLLYRVVNCAQRRNLAISDRIDKPSLCTWCTAWKRASLSRNWKLWKPLKTVKRDNLDTLMVLIFRECSRGFLFKLRSYLTTYCVWKLVLKSENIKSLCCKKYSRVKTRKNVKSLTSECFETVNSYWTLEKDKKNSKHYKTHLNVIESHEKRVIRYIRMQIGGKKRGIKTRVCRPRENSWVTCVHKLRMWTSVVISPLKGPKHGESILEQSRSLYRVARPV